MQSYEGQDALAWDVVNDPPPAMPGTGTALDDLRYMGIGQRILLNDPLPSVAGSIAKLRLIHGNRRTARRQSTANGYFR